MSSTVPDPYVREVAEGIFAYIQPDGTWFLNNAGFLVGSRGVAMVDQCGTEQRARALFDRVREPGGRPVHTLINTHHHADHTFGNFVLPPETTIVGHRRARDEVIATGTGIAAAFQGPDWGEIQISPPFLCFEDRLSLFIDDLEVELIHFGTAAHTTNDIVVWIPERGVLFSGDLIFKGGTSPATGRSAVRRRSTRSRPISRSCSRPLGRGSKPASSRSSWPPRPTSGPSRL
jgi:cyclase